MADLIRALYDIGDCFFDDLKKEKNKITTSKSPKIYEFEISDLSKQLDAKIQTTNIKKHVCTRKAPAGKLFYPTIQLINKGEFKRQLSKGFDVQNRDVPKEALDALQAFIDLYTQDESIINLDDIDISTKEAAFASLLYQDQTYYEIFPSLFDDFCSEPEIIDKPFTGVDFPTQKRVEVGYDANLSFCSSYEITKVNKYLAKNVKKHLLPLSKDSAIKVKLGYEIAIKGTNFNFNISQKLKMTVLPSMLGDVKREKRDELFESLKDLRKDTFNEKLEAFEELGDFINDLVKIAKIEEKSGIAVANTILLFEQSNAKIAILRTIDDVLPSQILKIKRAMSAERYNITTKSIYEQNQNLHTDVSKVAFYFPNFLKEELGIGRVHNANIFLLDDRKIGEDEFLNSSARLNFQGGFRTTFRDIQILADFLYEIDKTPKHCILRKQEDFMDINTVDDLQKSLDNTPLVGDNATLKAAYWLGTLYCFLCKREYALSDKIILKRKRNLLGILDFNKLSKMYILLEETAIKIDKIDEKKGIGKKASYCKAQMVKSYSSTLENTPASKIQLAFSAGEEDARELAKKKKNSEEEN
jgi:hypothetical protein